MTIFDLLARRQREVHVLFRQVFGRIADGEDDLAQTAFRRLTVKLLAMMHAEHAVVYPHFAFQGLRDEVQTAQREHEQIEQTINHLRLAPLAPQEWRRVFEMLERMVTAHCESEEMDLFPMARLTLPREDSEQIARDYQAFETMASTVAGPSITYDVAS